MTVFNRSLPLWYQLAEPLRAEIVDGQLPPGARVSPEVELARRYGVSVVTVRQALKRVRIVTPKALSPRPEPANLSRWFPWREPGARSRAPRTASSVSVGYARTISGIVMPAASDSSRNAIEIRVPATRGFPPRRSGSATIHLIARWLSLALTLLYRRRLPAVRYVLSPTVAIFRNTPVAGSAVSTARTTQRVFRYSIRSRFCAPARSVP